MIACTKQLGIEDDPAPLLAQYATAWQVREHSREIQHLYEYRDFASQPQHFQLIRWLYTHAWLTAERPSVLFDLATKRLVEQKILLPGVSVLERLVASVRDHAANRLWQRLASLPSASQRFLLEDLLQTPEGQKQSSLDRLRRSPTHVSGPGLIKALRRLTDIRVIGIGNLDLSFVPAGRLKQMARHAASSHAAQIERMAENRRIATLLAWASVFEAIAQDEALDLLDGLMRTLWTRATRAGERERLRTLRESSRSGITTPGSLLGSPRWDASRSAGTRESVRTGCTRGACPGVYTYWGTGASSRRHPALSGEARENMRLSARSRPPLLRTVTFQATPGGRPVLEAVTFLARTLGRKNPPIDEAPRGVIERGWRRYIISREGKEEHIDRKAYTICVVERLQEALRRHELFVSLVTNAGLIPVPNCCKEPPGKQCVHRSVKRLDERRSRGKPFRHCRQSYTLPINKRKPILLPILPFVLSRKKVKIISFSLHWIV